jgi:hypothetical protein
MCCPQSYFHQMDSFHQYSKQTLYFYSPLQILDTEDKKFSTEFHPQGVESPHHFPMLLRMPAHQFRIPRVGEHTFQMIDHWKVPHHQGKNFPLRHVLFIKSSLSRLASSSTLSGPIEVLFLFLSFSS